jgi:hypothetical protein
MRSFAILVVLAFLSSCATDPAPRLSREPPSADPADAGSNGSDAPPGCAPNVGAHCASDQDCAQCADVHQAFGARVVRVATAVQCIDSVCVKTGCPTERCPRGQTCTGCVANLPCVCRTGP